MNAKLQERCELLIQNRNAIAAAFRWDSASMHLCVASMYMLHGITLDSQRLKDCKKLIDRSVGSFNYFRGTGVLALAAMLDLSGDPQTTLDRAFAVYDKLKTHFSANSYLPMSAMMIPRHTPVSHFDEICAASRDIYDRMKKEHPFLTSSEDCSCCTLMALSGMNPDLLINDMETSYALMKKTFSGNALQSLSHALSLYPGDPVIKAQRTLDFYQSLKERGYKWDTYYGLPMLGVVALTDNDQLAMMQYVMEVSDWLKQQKGFSGFWTTISHGMRHMYAGMIVNAVIAADSNTNLTTMSANSIIAAIIAEQAAMSAVIAVSATSH